MDRFEYEITRHGSETFTKLVYFCTEKGECDLADVPAKDPTALAAILNQKGAEGWELVQMMFGEGGVMACWKRKAQG